MKKGFSMQETMSFRQISAVSLMLFAMFFGAGNMIFPPMLGAMAGENLFPAMLGFVAGDAGLAVLAIAAVTIVGNNLNDLGRLVGKGFASVFGLVIYLLIGPLFALPRTGTVAFELSIAPFLGGGSTLLPSLLFTAVFFGTAYYLSSNPNKIVYVVGQILTPTLLVAIALIFISALMNPYGTLGVPQGGYATNPFSTGFVEGYNALDGPAGLAFAVIVITAIQACGIRQPRQVAKYTIISGIGSAFLLAIVYFALAYLGGCSGALGSFANGGQMLTAIASTTVGKWGMALLGVTVLLACLTTAIGLITAFGEYVSNQYPQFSYHQVAIVTTLFSFAIANVGLSTLIKFSLPVLLIIYPVTIVLIIQAFFHHAIGQYKAVYWLGLFFALVVSVIQSLDGMGIALGSLTAMIVQLPLYEQGMGWLLPAVVGSLLGRLLPASSN